jgi:translation initiation factor IF-1
MSLLSLTFILLLCLYVQNTVSFHGSEVVRRLEKKSMTHVKVDGTMGLELRGESRLYMAGRNGGRTGMRRGRGGGRGPRLSKEPKDDVVQVTGKVIESLPNAMFRVEVEPSKQIVLVTVSGKIRKNFVRIVVGDSVVCELSAYDLTRGRITYRNKN